MPKYTWIGVQRGGSAALNAIHSGIVGIEIRNSITR